MDWAVGRTSLSAAALVCESPTHGEGMQPRALVGTVKKLNRADVTLLGRSVGGSPPSQGEWIEDHPDHGCLSVEVQKVGS
jgi:hypothetical protein